MASDEDLRTQHLDVYDTRDGPWNPDHGDIDIPEDWELLPAGDAFVTRTVKAAGVYWVAWKPRTRQRPHRRLIGLWAPRGAIEAARAAAVATEERRARQRKQGEAHRRRREAAYQAQLRTAILGFLTSKKPIGDSLKASRTRQALGRPSSAAVASDARRRSASKTGPR